MADPRDIKLDTDGDWAMELGDLAFVSGADSVRQHVEMRLRTFLGEWFLDASVGVPWFESILTKITNENLVRTVLKNTIDETPGVIDVLQVSANFDRSARTLSVSYTAATDLGEIDGTLEVS